MPMTYFLNYRMAILRGGGLKNYHCAFKLLNLLTKCAIKFIHFMQYRSSLYISDIFKIILPETEK